VNRAPDRSTGTPGPAVWLVRHGETTWNALGLVQGQRTEPRLTRRGAAQARDVAGHFEGRAVRALYTSDLLRAVETARPVAAVLGLEPVVDRRLRERAFGSAESMPSSLLRPEHSGLDGSRVVDPDAAPPGGESLRQLRRRVGDFLDELVADDDLGHGSAGDVVLVVHGGVVRAALAHLDGVPVGEMAWGPVGNGQVTPRPLLPYRRALPAVPTSGSPTGSMDGDVAPPPVPA
jgi:2,3-bisphosphoglycerate-dependent phosphoglycerate mutase